MRAGDRARRLATWLLLGASLAGALLFVGHAPRDAVRRRAHRVLRGRLDDGRRPDLAHRSSAARPRDRRSGRGGWDRPMEAWAGLVLDPSRRAAGRRTDVAYVVGAQRRAEASIDVTWAAPAIGATLAAGWSVILFSIAIAAVAALVFARRPDVPAATALVIVAVRGGRQQRAVVPRARRPAISSWAARSLFHAFLTGVLYMVMWPAAVAPRPRVPGAAARVGTSPVADPRRVRRRARGVRGGPRG